MNAHVNKKDQSANEVDFSSYLNFEDDEDNLPLGTTTDLHYATTGYAYTTTFQDSQKIPLFALNNAPEYSYAYPNAHANVTPNAYQNQYTAPHAPAAPNTYESQPTSGDVYTATYERNADASKYETQTIPPKSSSAFQPQTMSSESFYDDNGTKSILTKSEYNDRRASSQSVSLLLSSKEEKDFTEIEPGQSVYQSVPEPKFCCCISHRRKRCCILTLGILTVFGIIFGLVFYFWLLPFTIKYIFENISKETLLKFMRIPNDGDPAKLPIKDLTFAFLTKEPGLSTYLLGVGPTINFIFFRLFVKPATWAIHRVESSNQLATPFISLGIPELQIAYPGTPTLPIHLNVSLPNLQHLADFTNGLLTGKGLPANVGKISLTGLIDYYCYGFPMMAVKIDRRMDFAGYNAITFFQELSDFLPKNYIRLKGHKLDLGAKEKEILFTFNIVIENLAFIHFIIPASVLRIHVGGEHVITISTSHLEVKSGQFTFSIASRITLTSNLEPFIQKNIDLAKKALETKTLPIFGIQPPVSLSSIPTDASSPAIQWVQDFTKLLNLDLPLDLIQWYFRQSTFASTNSVKIKVHSQTPYLVALLSVAEGQLSFPYSDLVALSCSVNVYLRENQFLTLGFSNATIQNGFKLFTYATISPASVGTLESLLRLEGPLDISLRDIKINQGSFYPDFNFRFPLPPDPVDAILGLISAASSLSEVSTTSSSISLQDLLIASPENAPQMHINTALVLPFTIPVQISVDLPISMDYGIAQGGKAMTPAVHITVDGQYELKDRLPLGIHLEFQQEEPAQNAFASFFTSPQAEMVVSNLKLGNVDALSTLKWVRLSTSTFKYILALGKAIITQQFGHLNPKDPIVRLLVELNARYGKLMEETFQALSVPDPNHPPVPAPNNNASVTSPSTSNPTLISTSLSPTDVSSLSAAPPSSLPNVFSTSSMPLDRAKDVMLISSSTTGSTPPSHSTRNVGTTLLPTPSNLSPNAIYLNSILQKRQAAPRPSENLLEKILQSPLLSLIKTLYFGPSQGNAGIAEFNSKIFVPTVPLLKEIQLHKISINFLFNQIPILNEKLAITSIRPGQDMEIIGLTAFSNELVKAWTTFSLQAIVISFNQLQLGPIQTFQKARLDLDIKALLSDLMPNAMPSSSQMMNLLTDLNALNHFVDQLPVKIRARVEGFEDQSKFITHIEVDMIDIPIDYTIYLPYKIAFKLGPPKSPDMNVFQLYSDSKITRETKIKMDAILEFNTNPGVVDGLSKFFQGQTASSVSLTDLEFLGCRSLAGLQFFTFNQPQILLFGKSMFGDLFNLAMGSSSPPPPSSPSTGTKPVILNSRPSNFTSPASNAAKSRSSSVFSTNAANPYMVKPTSLVSSRALPPTQTNTRAASSSAPSNLPSANKVPSNVAQPAQKAVPGLVKRFSNPRNEEGMSLYPSLSHSEPQMSLIRRQLPLSSKGSSGNPMESLSDAKTASDLLQAFVAAAPMSSNDNFQLPFDNSNAPLAAPAAQAPVSLAPPKPVVTTKNPSTVAVKPGSSSSKATGSTSSKPGYSVPSSSSSSSSSTSSSPNANLLDLLPLPPKLLPLMSFIQRSDIKPLSGDFQGLDVNTHLKLPKVPIVTEIILPSVTLTIKINELQIISILLAPLKLVISEGQFTSRIEVRFGPFNSSSSSPPPINIFKPFYLGLGGLCLGQSTTTFSKVFILPYINLPNPMNMIESAMKSPTGSSTAMLDKLIKFIGLRDIQVVIAEKEPKMDIVSVINPPRLPFEYTLQLPVCFRVSVDGLSAKGSVFMTIKLDLNINKNLSVKAPLTVLFSNDDDSKAAVTALITGKKNKAPVDPAISITGLQLANSKSLSSIRLLSITRSSIFSMLSQVIQRLPNDPMKLIEMGRNLHMEPSANRPGYNIEIDIKIPALPLPIVSIKTAIIKAKTRLYGIPFMEAILAPNTIEPPKGTLHQALSSVFDNSPEVIQALASAQNRILVVGLGHLTLGGIATFEQAFFDLQFDLSKIPQMLLSPSQAPSAFSSLLQGFDLKQMLLLKNVAFSTSAPSILTQVEFRIPPAILKIFPIRYINLGPNILDLKIADRPFIQSKLSDIVLTPNSNVLQLLSTLTFSNAEESQAALAAWIRSLVGRGNGYVKFSVTGLQFGAASLPVKTFTGISLEIPIKEIFDLLLFGSIGSKGDLVYAIIDKVSSMSAGMGGSPMSMIRNVFLQQRSDSPAYNFVADLTIPIAIQQLQVDTFDAFVNLDVTKLLKISLSAPFMIKNGNIRVSSIAHFSNELETQKAFAAAAEQVICALGSKAIPNGVNSVGITGITLGSAAPESKILTFQQLSLPIAFPYLLQKFLAGKLQLPKLGIKDLLKMPLPKLKFKGLFSVVADLDLPFNFIPFPLTIDLGKTTVSTKFQDLVLAVLQIPPLRKPAESGVLQVRGTVVDVLPEKGSLAKAIGKGISMLKAGLSGFTVENMVLIPPGGSQGNDPNSIYTFQLAKFHLP